MNKIVVITAGGTSEKIDNVRKITNSSTGKLANSIAEELLKRDDLEQIFYICSKTAIRPINNKVKIIEIEGVTELKTVVLTILKENQIDLFIHSMAVSDYMVDYVTNSKLLSEELKNKKDILKEIQSNTKIIKSNKISSYYDDLLIRLVKTPKIISLIKRNSPKTYLVGFKLLENVGNEELIYVAIELLNKNNCDLVVANDLYRIKNNNHEGFIIDKKNNIIHANGKNEIAYHLVRKIFSEI